MSRALMLPSALLLLLSVSGAAQQRANEPPAQHEQLGTVRFVTSCSAAAQPQFDRSVALLHSFEFGAAVAGFEQTLTLDSSCAMAHWGIALSRWGNPFAVGIRSPQQVKAGLAAVQRAAALRAGTARERAYLDAVSKLYADASQRPQDARVEAYRDAMAQLVRAYPDDVEAAIFYALSLTAAEDLADKTYASRLQAVEILQPLFQKYSNHPGLAHYLIHSYDVPALAPRALDAAQRYAQIAPSAPHALHMPSHTFTRVGRWQASIDTNIASAAAARQQKATAEELHASDYQMYAYLQTAQDAAARQLLDSLPEIASRFDPTSIASAAPPSAGYYAIAAIPARWALERGAWAEAAKLELRPSDYPYADALTVFTRGFGAARSGDTAGARAALAELETLRTRQAAMNEAYWTQQIEIQRQSVTAWLEFTEGRASKAVAQLRAAADAEDRTEKAAVTPGPLAPAREQLAEMLLETKDASGALREFQATLVKEPNRFRTLYGAARAAAAADERELAERYFSALVTMCERASGPLRVELEHARNAIRRAP